MEGPGHEKRNNFRFAGQGIWELLSSHSTTNSARRPAEDDRSHLHRFRQPSWNLIAPFWFEQGVVPVQDQHRSLARYRSQVHKLSERTARRMP